MKIISHVYYILYLQCALRRRAVYRSSCFKTYITVHCYTIYIQLTLLYTMVRNVHCTAPTTQVHSVYSIHAVYLCSRCTTEQYTPLHFMYLITWNVQCALRLVSYNSVLRIIITLQLMVITLQLMVITLRLISLVMTSSWQQQQQQLVIVWLTHPFLLNITPLINTHLP